MAERVGFVPCEPASCNDLQAIHTARTRQIHSNSEYEVQNRYSAIGLFQRYPSRVEAISVADKNLGATHPLLRKRSPLRFHTTVRPVVSRSDDSLQASSWPVPAMSGMSLTVNADASAKAVALDVRFVRPAVPETTAETAHRRNRRVASWGIGGRAASAGEPAPKASSIKSLRKEAICPYRTSTGYEGADDPATVTRLCISPLHHYGY
jgi:hypothetical protein